MAAKRCREKGFSFVELVVALAVVAASFGVLIAAHTAAARQEAHARSLFTASALMRQLLTQAEIDGYPQNGDSSGDFGDDYPGFSWSRKITDADLSGMVKGALEKFGVDPALIPVSMGGVRQVELEVKWLENEKPVKVAMTYYAVAQQ